MTNAEDAGVAGRLAMIRERIAAAARRAGRDAGEITLIGASKRQDDERLRTAREAGLEVFGENRVQEAEAHRRVVAGADWHLIGPLQSNKAAAAAEIFSTVHSIDRLKIARKLDAAAAARGRRLECFLEVNLAAEDSKSGFLPGSLARDAAPIASLTNLVVVGLMAIPPFPDDPEESRPWFRRLREISGELSARPEWRGWPGKLSMGMSADFEVAIEEGATHVRIGTDLFGARAPAR